MTTSRGRLPTEAQFHYSVIGLTEETSVKKVPAGGAKPLDADYLNSDVNFPSDALS
jgi:hypothetical protein